MGQGGGQGIEDAYYLSHMLKQFSGPQQAFTAFEKERRQKVDFIVNTSWRIGKLAHSYFGKTLFRR